MNIVVRKELMDEKKQKNKNTNGRKNCEWTAKNTNTRSKSTNGRHKSTSGRRKRTSGHEKFRMTIRKVRMVVRKGRKKIRNRQRRGGVADTKVRAAVIKEKKIEYERP